MDKIIDSKLCNGCHACYSVCPVSAIKMIPDREGFLSPIIDNSVCVDCGKCTSICPLLMDKSKREGLSSETDPYGCINLDNIVRNASSSGGVFSLLAEEVILHDGVVFGARFNDVFNVVHDYTETLEGASHFMGSKYVQSDIGRSFIHAKDFLDSGRLVLFSGTPCQIGGLLAYLQKDYENLLCVDLICHGVPSPILWSKYLEYHKAKNGDNLESVCFRNKKEGWYRYSLILSFESNKYVASLTNDPYMYFFLNNFSLRYSCYDCGFKTKRRQADITLADFWGVDKTYPEIFDDKGTSLVFVNTLKGKKAFQSLSGKASSMSVDATLALKYNSAMLNSVTLPKQRYSFFTDLGRFSFGRMIVKYYYLDRLKKIILRPPRKILRMATKVYSCKVLK